MKNQILFFALLLGISCTKEDVNPDNDSITLECRYDQGTILTNHNPDGIDYIANCSVEVFGGDLVIEEGTSIFFTEEGYLDIALDGRLVANGTDALPITLTGDRWAGISLDNANGFHSLKYTMIENAGFFEAHGVFNDYKGALTAYTGVVKLDNCSIKNSFEHGLIMLNTSEIDQVSQCSFIDNNGYPIILETEGFDSPDFTTSAFTGNKHQMIMVTGVENSDDYSNEEPVINNPIPYYFHEGIELYSHMRINSGVEIIFGEDSYLDVAFEKLSINGSIGDTVIMRGLESQEGFWHGIFIYGNNKNMTFNYLKISDGASKPFDDGNLAANIKVGGNFDVTLTLNHCVSLRSGNCDVATNDIFVEKQINTVDSDLQICREQ